MESTVEAVCNQLARNRLLEAEAVRGLRGQWRGEAGPAADNVGEFRKWLVKKGNVTEFQLDLLDRGYADFLNFGEYKIQGKIGTGRMAGVYKAVHPLGQTVAIKVLPPSKSKHTQVLGRFLRESRLAAKLDHDNVVRTFQNGVHQGMHYLVMEYLEGETLEDTLRRRKRLPVEEALAITAQALQGLDHLHEIGLVHRDLKPANLMLVHGEHAAPGDSTLQQTVKILDMGLGRALFDEGTPGTPDAANLTCEGAILGTLNYMAPEQARDAHAADIRSDIYSLGCVLYEMLCGQAPFQDANIARQMRRHAEETPRAVHEVVPGVPAAVDQVVQKMLAKDPALRYSTPGQVLRDIKALAPPPLAKPVRPKRSYLTWLETQRQDEVPPPGNTALPAPETHVSPSASPASIPVAAPVAMPVVPKPMTPIRVPATVPTTPVAPVVSAPAGPKQPNPIVTVAKAMCRRIYAFGWGKRDWIAAALGAVAVLLIQGLLWLLR